MPLLKVDLASVRESDANNPDVSEPPQNTAPDIPSLSPAQYKAKLLECFTKCINSSNTSKQVPVYYNYHTRSTTTPRSESKFPPSYMLSSFLMVAFNLGMTEAKKVTSLLNAFNKRALDRTIVYREKPVNLSKYPVNVHSLFDNTTVITDKFMTIEACIVKDEAILQELNLFTELVNNLAISDHSKSKTITIYKPLIQIPVSEFLSMSATSRLSILSRTVNIKRNILNVALNIKQDIGNLGREYHLLANVPRPDRAKISNLYGYDFESALQVIVLAIMKEVNTQVSISITENFVKNKAEVRQYVVDILDVNMDLAKKIITAAYQGGGIRSIPQMIGSALNKNQIEGMKDLYVETKQIILELLKISSSSFTNSDTVLGKHFIAARWYASKRTSIKWELVADFNYEYYLEYEKKYNKVKAFKFAKSYMFYLWTYFEGEARKILATHLKQPISLHDAVYTQDKDSFDKMVVKDVEDEILQKIGIPLRLGKA